jgi:YHS domain-containing protein
MRSALAIALLLLPVAAAAQQPALPAADKPAETRPDAPPQPDWKRAPDQWNVPDDYGVRLAIQGWDPVAYFPEGGGKPQQGKDKITTVLGGVTYYFASEDHKKLFLADPWKYEPAFGGWCAFAMAKGDKVEIDPESFRIVDGRLFLFYKGLFNDTRSKWIDDEAALMPKADAAWVKLSGELNRGDKARDEALKKAEAARQPAKPAGG